MRLSRRLWWAQGKSLRLQRRLLGSRPGMPEGFDGGRKGFSIHGEAFWMVRRVDLKDRSCAQAPTPLTMRALKRKRTPILSGYQLFHNYIRPHEALGGKTPAEACGIKVEGQNKWKTMIQNASKYKKWASS